MNQLLSKNACLGLWAPASPCDPEIVQRGVTYLQSLGYRTKAPRDPSAAWGNPLHLFSSDTPIDRINSLYALFEDPEVEAVISVRGGYGTMEILPLLDFKRLSKNIKPLVGISDVTVLLNSLGLQTDIRTVHGAVFPNGFAKAATVDNSRESCTQLLDLLTAPQKRTWTCNRTLNQNVAARGRAIGGNLAMLAAIAGTRWEPVYDDGILFIEEIGERPYRIHRELLQLKLAGSLDKLRGVVVGELVDCPTPAGSTIDSEQVFCDIFAGAQYPVLLGAPFGHGERNFPFVVGESVEILGTQVVLG